MTLTQISDPTLLLALRADLAAHAGCVVTAVAPDILGVAVVDVCRSDATDTETALRVRGWQDAQRSHGINVRVEFAAGRC